MIINQRFSLLINYFKVGAIKIAIYIKFVQ